MDWYMETPPLLLMEASPLLPMEAAPLWAMVQTTHHAQLVPILSVPLPQGNVGDVGILRVWKQRLPQKIQTKNRMNNKKKNLSAEA